LVSLAWKTDELDVLIGKDELVSTEPPTHLPILLHRLDPFVIRHARLLHTFIQRIRISVLFFATFYIVEDSFPFPSNHSK